MRLSMEDAGNTKMIYIYLKGYDESERPCVTLKAVANVCIKNNVMKAFRVNEVINNTLGYDSDMFLNSLRLSLEGDAEVSKDDKGNILATFETETEKCEKDIVWEEAYCLFDIDRKNHGLLGIELIV